MLKMDLEYNKGILFVRLKGILNKKNSYKIYNYLNPIIKKHQIEYLVYNLFYLEDIDDSGIDSIVNSKIEIKKNNGKILFCEVNNKIKKKLIGLRIKQIESEQSVYKLIGA